MEISNIFVFALTCDVTSNSEVKFFNFIWKIPSRAIHCRCNFSPLLLVTEIVTPPPQQRAGVGLGPAGRGFLAVTVHRHSRRVLPWRGRGCRHGGRPLVPILAQTRCLGQGKGEEGEGRLTDRIWAGLPPCTVDLCMKELEFHSSFFQVMSCDKETLIWNTFPQNRWCHVLQEMSLKFTICNIFSEMCYEKIVSDFFFRIMQNCLSNVFSSSSPFGRADNSGRPTDVSVTG